MKIKKLKLKPENLIEFNRRKYLDDQQEVFCDGVMLHYNKDKKHFEITEVVSGASFWIDGLDVDIKSDKYGALYIQGNICERCNGEMRIEDYEHGDRYSEDGMMPCPQCEGDGYEYE